MRKKITWYYVLLFFAVAGVVITAIIRVLTPQTVLVPATPLLQQAAGNAEIVYRNLTYTGPEFAPPASLPVAQLQPSSDSSTTLLQEVLSAYNLTPHPRVENLWVNGGTSLTYNSQTQQASLIFTQPITPESEQNYTQPFPLVEAQNKAQSTISETFPFLSDVTLNESLIKTYEGGYDLEPTDNLLHASAAIFPFGWSIESIPVFISASQTYPAEVMINRDLAILRVMFNPTRFNYTLTPSHPVLSVQEALSQLNTSQQGILLSFVTQTGTIATFSDITSGELTNVSLEYRVDQNSNLIYPFYRFSGTVTTPTGTSAVDIATPAIKTISP